MLYYFREMHIETNAVSIKSMYASTPCTFVGEIGCKCNQILAGNKTMLIIPDLTLVLTHSYGEWNCDRLHTYSNYFHLYHYSLLTSTHLDFNSSQRAAEDRLTWQKIVADAGRDVPRATIVPGHR